MITEASYSELMEHQCTLECSLNTAESNDELTLGCNGLNYQQEFQGDVHKHFKI